MARIRTIKPEFWADEKMAPLSPIDRLVFLGLISMADDAGRVVDSVRAIDGFIFPETDDSARESLDRLVDLARIERGVTASGQRVLQIVNWSHQKIDKPNMASALPPIAILDASSTRRRSVPAKLRDAIFERDSGVCQLCDTPVRRDKRDKYDADSDLAEVDHIVPVKDGGTNDPQNLRLLCLACNRKKAGEDARRRNAESSSNDRRTVADVSTPHINDLGSTINDQRPTIDEQRAQPLGAGGADEATAEALRSLVGDEWPDVRRFLESRKRETRPAWIREMLKLIGPGSQFTAQDLSGTCADALALDEPLGGPHALRAFIAKRAFERVAATTGGALPSPGRTAGQDEAQRIVANIRRLIARNGTSRFVPRAKVEAMGPRILNAYDSVGGAERFLQTDANSVKFLPYEFARALAAQDGDARVSA